MRTAPDDTRTPDLRRLLLLVGCLVLVDTMFFSAVTPLLPHYAHRLGLSKAGAGLLSASYAVGTFAGAIPSGLLAARVGVRATVYVGLTGMAVTSIVFGLANSIWLLDVARFVQGFAGACSWTGGLAWLVALAPSERRGELIGAAMGAAIGGSLLGPVLGAIASVTGTGPAFGAVAGLGVVLAFAASRTPAHPPNPRQPLRLLAKAVRDERLLAGMWFVVLPGLLFGTLGVLAPLRLSHLGFSEIAIGAVFLVSAAIEATLNPVLGRISDRRGRLTPLQVGLVASVVMALVLPWLGNRWLLAGAILVAGAAFGFFWTPAFSLLADAAEQRGLDHSYGFALMNLAWAPGQALGAGGGGALAAATFDGVPFVALAAVCGVTLVVLRARVGRLSRPQV